MKHVYDSDSIVKSEDFELDDYVNRDLFRQAKKEEKLKKNSSDLTELYCLINDSEQPISYISKLTDFVQTDKPELRDTLFDNFYVLKSYVDDKRNYSLNQKIDKSYDDYKEIELKYQVKFEEYVQELAEKVNIKDEYIAYLKQFIEKITLTDMQNVEYQKLVQTYETFKLFEDPDIEIW